MFFDSIVMEWAAITYDIYIYIYFFMCLTVDLQLKLIATTEKVPNS